MNPKRFFFSFFIFCIIISVVAQKSNTVKSGTVALSTAEKMGYKRTNQYWGPGTYYCFAPGTPKVKMVNNRLTALRDLTGISREDFFTEINKQGFTEVPTKEVKKWFNENGSKDKKFYYSPDKSYILKPEIKDMYNSAKGNYMPYAASTMESYILVPVQDSLKVIEMAWQFLRDINDLKLVLSSFGSTFKKANPKIYPIDQAGSTGWSSMRAGTFVLLTENGKPKGYWQRNEDIIRRTIGKPEFKLIIQAAETDFWYGLRVQLQKEGYVLTYTVIAGTMKDLEPGSNWTQKHKEDAENMKTGEAMDKQAIELYKKAPLPPVLEDLNKLLHIK